MAEIRDVRGNLVGARHLLLVLALALPACGSGGSGTDDAGAADAPEGGDDAGETDAGGCQADEFVCEGGACLDAARVCDGIDDCGDGSDETCEGIRAETWRVAEISLVASPSYANPFVDVEVQAVFRHTDGTEITRAAFWYEGDTWKIRFAPTKTGRWTYRTTCSNTDDTGLHDQTGDVIGVPYQGPYAIYQHGFLTASADGRYLTHRDGTPFFYLADTHWFMESEDYDSAFAPMMLRRAEQGYTAIQSHPVGSTLSNSGATQIDPAKYAALDRYFALIADQGQVHAFGLGAHSVIDYFTQEGAERVARYMNARYGAYPVIFFTSQEVDLWDNQDKWKHAFDAWNEVDAYDQPTTCHVIGSTSGEPTLWGDDPGHDLFFLQGGHGTVHDIAHYQAYWGYDAPTKPFIEAEANYEEITLGGENHADRVRNAAYKALQTGAAGFGYGANGIWNLCTSEVDCACCEEWGIDPWYQAIHFPAGAEMRYLAGFYTAVPWWKLVPRFSDASWASFADPERSVLSTAGSDVYAAYFYGASSSGTLAQMQSGQTYTARWFDPRTGTCTLIDDAIAPSGGQWSVPPKPDGQDWMLLVSRNGAATGFRTIQASAGSGGAIFPAGLRLAPAAESRTYRLVPDAGYAIATVTVDGAAAIPCQYYIAAADGLDHTISATFTGARPAGLIAEWRLEGYEEDRAHDSSGSADGVLRGAAFVRPDGAAGNCVDLDGQSGVVEIGDLSQLEGMSQLTLSAWVRLDALPAAGRSVAPVGKEQSYRIVIGSDGAAHFALATTGNAWYSAGTTVDFGSSPLAPGVWYHLAATYDGANLRSYVDGVAQSTSATAISGTVAVGTSPLRFGDPEADNVDFLDGRIDEVRIYDRALSPAEIAALHDETSP